MPEIPFDMALETTVEGTILMRVRERIQEMSLPGILDERVVIRKLPWVADDDLLPPPYILVSPAPESINWAIGTNETDTTIFGVMISFILANGRDVTTNGMGLQLYWLEMFRRKFQNRAQGTFSTLTLPNSAIFVHCFVESGDKFIEAAKRDLRDANYYILRIAVREPRDS